MEDADAVREDINGDGQPDRTTVVDGDRVSCRAMDFNFDGLIDAWIYMDEAGQLRRRESDYDRDGRVDEVALYRAGVLTERQRATSLSGKLDTWQQYENGKVARAERDSNGDDYVDQWWEYPAERQPDCPLIHSDVNGDGRPDPGATVDVCRNQYQPASRDGEPAPGTLDAEGVSDLPTEVETRGAPGASPSPEVPGPGTEEPAGAAPGGAP